MCGLTYFQFFFYDIFKPHVHSRFSSCPWSTLFVIGTEYLNTVLAGEVISWPACLPSLCFFSRIFRLVYIKFGIWLELNFSCIFVSHCYCLITTFTVQWKMGFLFEILPKKEGYLGAFAKFRKAFVTVVISVRVSVSFFFCAPVRPNKTAWLPLTRFSWNLIFDYFSKICRESSRFIKIWR